MNSQINNSFKKNVLFLRQHQLQPQLLAMFNSLLFSFLNLNDQECQSSASTAKYRIIFQRTALSWRLVLQHLMHSSLVSMRSSCQKKRRNYLQRNRRMRQKTSDFHQRCDERCVNFFNNEQLRWFLCFEIFDYWMCTI